MTAAGAAVPRSTSAAIQNAVDVFPAGRLGGLAHDSQHLVIKYMPAKYGGSYSAPGRQLHISDTAGFTWGTGTYVTPLCFPISSAIFGRVGVVAGYDPTGWRVFDATTTANQNLYLRWAGFQPMARLAALTTSSAHYNQQLRNLFRIRFDIDCVLFPPDQINAVYTDPADVWMNVTDWTPARGIASGKSGRFSDPRIAVLADDEFEDILGGTQRKALLAFTTTRPAALTTAATIANNYLRGSGIVRVKA